MSSEERDIDELSDAFQDLCVQRMETGAEEYGKGAFLNESSDPFKEMLEELADVSNWAQLAFIKLVLAKRNLEHLVNTNIDSIGAQAFMPSSEGIPNEASDWTGP